MPTRTRATTKSDGPPTTLPEPRKQWSRSAMRSLRPGLLVPELPSAPEAVREAAAKARELWDVWQEAKLAQQDAEEDAKSAPELDQAADRRALDAGEEDLPEPTAPAKRKALAEANRRRLAAEEAVYAAIEEQAAAIRENYGEWLGAERNRVEERTTAVRELLDSLASELDALAVDRNIRDALDRFSGHPDSWDLKQRRRGGPAEARRKAKEKIETGHRLQPNATRVEFATPAVLAALEILVEEGSP